MTTAPLKRLLALGVIFAMTACSDHMSLMSSPRTVVLSISPQGGATDVASTARLVIVFSGRMKRGTEQYVALHRDSLRGTTVPCTCTWSGTDSILSCTPASTLSSGTRYVTHMGGGMMDADGHMLSYANCPMHGGSSVTCTMMGAGGMMRAGWTGSDGNYGMQFAFTTR